MKLFRRYFFITLYTLSCLVGVANIAAAELPPVFSPDNVAINGYDPVGYFADGQPVKGNKDYSVVWRGTTWHFASEANRDQFEMNPAAYAPQYGGYCAYAVSRGYTATTAPEAWRIVDDKLYLNYSLNVREIWSQDIPGNIKKADRNWPDVLKK